MVTEQAGFILNGTVVSALFLAVGAVLMRQLIAGITAMQTGRGVA